MFLVLTDIYKTEELTPLSIRIGIHTGSWSQAGGGEGVRNIILDGSLQVVLGFVFRGHQGTQRGLRYLQLHCLRSGLFAPEC